MVSKSNLSSLFVKIIYQTTLPNTSPSPSQASAHIKSTKFHAHREVLDVSNDDDNDNRKNNKKKKTNNDNTCNYRDDHHGDDNDNYHTNYTRSLSKGCRPMLETIFNYKLYMITLQRFSTNARNHFQLKKVSQWKKLG